MESFLEQDDIDNLLFTDVITDNKKKGTNWLITLYKEDLDYDDIKSNLETFPHIKCFVFQIEIGEKTKKKHFHACITLNISSSKPLPQFKKRFPNVHIQIIDNVKYLQSYCCKSQTADEKYEPYYFNINPNTIEVWGKKDVTNELDITLKKLRENSKTKQFFMDIFPSLIDDLYDKQNKYNESIFLRDKLAKYLSKPIVPLEEHGIIKDIIFNMKNLFLENNKIKLIGYKNDVEYLNSQIGDKIKKLMKLKDLIQKNNNIDDERVSILKSEIDNMFEMKLTEEKEKIKKIESMYTELENEQIKNLEKINKELNLEKEKIKNLEKINKELSYKTEKENEKLNSIIKDLESKNKELIFKNENEKLIFENEKINFENEKLIFENEKINFENEKLNFENEKLNFENENEKLNSENERLNLIIKELKCKNKELISENTNENDKLNLKIKELKCKNKELISENENENDKLNLKIKELKSKNKELISENENENDKLNLKIKNLKSKIKELINENENKELKNKK